MNTAARLAVLSLALLAVDAVLLLGIHQETRPASVRSAPVEVRNHRYLMQSQANPSTWEALEVMASDPGQYVRTELSASQARRWALEGGFRQVSNQEYNDRLAIAGGYAAARAQGGVALASLEQEL